MNKKKFLIPIIIAFILLLNCNPAYATTQVVGYTSHSSTSQLATYNQIAGMNLTDTVPSGTWYVYQVYAYLTNKTGLTAEGRTAKALLINSDGEISATGTNIVTVTEPAWYTFNFSHPVIADNYCLGVISDENVSVINSGGTNRFVDSTNSYSIPVDPTDGVTSVSNCAEIYAVITNVLGDTPGATSNPLPTGGAYDSTDTDTIINTFTGYLIPLILFLLPALILGWVTRWQKWPILIGLAIGSGLTYLFLGTQYLWLVVMTIIGIASMSYSDFRSSSSGGS